MLTYADDETLVRDDRPGYRPFVVRVARLTELAPHFTRVTFHGDDLEFFGRDLRDQRIKIVFPHSDGSFADFGQRDPGTGADWYSRMRELPLDDRNPFRTYTIRAVRPGESEIDVDFVSHGDGGPAARWLLQASAGQELVIVGPEVRSLHSAGGIDWHPGPAKQVLLAGDETAAPAISSILETLPDHVTAHAFIEVPDVADRLPIGRRGECVTWLARGERQHGESLIAAVRAFVGANRDYVLPALRDIPEQLADIDVDTELLWDSPVEANADFYAWLAGESSVIKTLRRHLVSETGVDRKQVAFMGYWRLGRAEN